MGVSMNYIIGLIEDDAVEASEIMLTLIENSNGDLDGSSFKQYELKRESDFKEKLLDTIENDILNNQIQCLLVDYKLDFLHEIVEGIEIVKHFHAIVPEFPVVILTNVPETGKENDQADPDKVYAKKDFLNPDSIATKAMVYNIIRNIKRYSNTRAALEIDRETALGSIITNGHYSEQMYDKLITTERELAKYSPIVLNALDEEYKSTDMEKAIKELKEIKELIQ